MGPKRFERQNFSLFLFKFKKLGFSAPLGGITKLDFIFSYAYKTCSWSYCGY